MKPPLQIVLKDDVKAILDCFTGCFGIRIAYFSPEGRELEAGLKRPMCQYCRLMREQLFSHQTCLQLDHDKRREAAEAGKLIHYQCHAGLREAIQPVLLDSHLIGFVMIGQFRTFTDLPIHVQEQWKTLKHAPELLQQAFEDVPYIRPSRLPYVLELFSMLVERIVQQHLVEVRGSLAVQQALRHLQNNLHRQVSLGEVADLLGRSESTVSHLFQQVLGKSFRQSLIETRLQKACEFLLTLPDAQISQIGQRVGYADPAHFSRLFRKHTGQSPREFRQQRLSGA